MTGSATAPSGKAKLNNKTFCTLPWVNVSVDPDGSVKPCCISTDTIKKQDGTKYNLGYDKLEDIYNSQHFQDIRKKMLAGEQVQGCVRCYEQEKISGTSSRLSYKHFKIKDKSEIQKNIEIQYFDLRFGNLCNLKCRTCNPTASNQIGKEIKEIRHTNIYKYWPLDVKDNNEWFATQTFSENLHSQIDHVKLLYLTGGEPTLNEENKQFLQSLVDSNNTDVTIKISTNMTNLNKNFYDLLKNFRSVIFFASIDGYGSIQEYLRYPSNWSQIEENLSKVVLHSNQFSVICTPVVQIGNLNKLVELFDYLESYNISANKKLITIDPILLEFPEHFNIKYLPYEYKLECWNKLENWYKYKCKFQSDEFRKKLHGIKNKCLENTDYLPFLQKYKEMNDILDNHRKHYLKDMNLELYEIIKDI